MWHATAGRIRFSHVRTHSFSSTAFSPDSKLLAAADYTSVSLNCRCGTPLVTHGIFSEILCMKSVGQATY